MRWGALRFDRLCALGVAASMLVAASLILPGVAHAEKPVRVFPASHIGGSDLDIGFDVAADSSGNSYVVGTTMSRDFPRRGGVDVTPGPRPPGCVNSCAAELSFVTKLDPLGHVVYSTVLPEQYEVGAVTANPDGSVWLSGGETDPRADRDLADALLMRLSPAGDAITDVRSIGGSGDDRLGEVEIGEHGSLYALGLTTSSDFPTTGNALEVHGSGMRPFVLKLDSRARPVYSTRLELPAYDLALGPGGSVYLVGEVFNVGAAPSATVFGRRAGSDAFVAKLTPGEPALDFTTILAGDQSDQANAIAVAEDGSLLVAGDTNSRDFPLENAFDSDPGPPRTFGGFDGFVATLTPDGADLVQSSYLGGTGDESIVGAALAPSGNAVLAGNASSDSTDFPVIGGYGPGSEEGFFLGGGFVVELNPGRRSIGSSTLFYGNNQTEIRSMTMAPSGRTLITGLNSSARPSGFSELRASNGFPNAYLAGISFDPFVGNPRVRIRSTQRQRGARVKVRLRAGAAEPISVQARGSLLALGRRIRLAREVRAAAAGERSALTLTTPTRGQSRYVFEALERRRSLRGRVTVRLRDPSGARVRRVEPIRLR